MEVPDLRRRRWVLGAVAAVAIVRLGVWWLEPVFAAPPVLHTPFGDARPEDAQPPVPLAGWTSFD